MRVELSLYSDYAIGMGYLGFEAQQRQVLQNVQTCSEAHLASY